MAQRLRDVMTDQIVTLPPSASVMEAGKAMADNDIGNVIVVDEGAVAGILTDRDIVVRAIAKGTDPTKTRIGEIVSEDVQTLPADASIGDAVRMMSDRAIRRIPVVEDGRPVGVVSIGDLVNWVMTQQDFTIHQLEDYITGKYPG